MIIYIIIIIFVYILYLQFTIKNIIDDDSTDFMKELNINGYKLVKNKLNSNHINDIKNLNNLDDIKNYLIKNCNILDDFTKNYILYDYIFVLNKSKIHTCHRDNNSKFFNKNQKHDSYTAIIFIEDMDKCINVIPGSHHNKYHSIINPFDINKTVYCNKGDILFFNASLIHAGTILKKENNMRIQLKIVHKDDINVLKHFDKYRKIINKNNNYPLPIQQLHQYISCKLPLISDMTQDTMIDIVKTDENNNFLKKLYSYLIYSDPNFY